MLVPDVPLRLFLILLGAASLAACASVDTTPSLRMGQSSGLTETKGLRARAAFRVDGPAVRAARTLRLEPVSMADAADDRISPRQSEVVRSALNQVLCARLSRHFEIVPEGAPADLVVRADITRMQTTNAGSAAASRIAGFVSPIPFTPRLPVGMGSLVVEGVASGPEGPPKAVIVWGRGADMFTTRAGASSIGDAYTLAKAFGADFAKLLIRGSDPFASNREPGRARRKAGPRECEAWGAGPGAAGFIGGRLGLPPEMTASKPKP
jgi:hypothetical protein